VRTARLAGLWFGNQAVWTAVLGVILQDRVTALVPSTATIATYAALATTGACIAAIVQLAAGFGSDRLRARTGDRRAFYAAGVAFAVPAVVVLPVASSLGVLWGAALLLQLGMNVASGPYQAVVGDYIEPAHVGRASAWMSVAQFSGSLAGLLLVTLLHGPLVGIALALCLIGGWGLTDWQVRRMQPIVRETTPLRLDRNAWIVITGRAAVNVGFYTLFGFLFFFVHESLGVSQRDAHTATGILFVAVTVAGLLGAVLAGRTSDRFDKRAVVSIACVAIVFALGAFAFAKALPLAVVCAAGAGVAWGAYFTADWALAYAVLPRGALARAMGVWNLASVLPQIAAPAITAPLVARLDARHAGLGPRGAIACVIVEFVLGTVWLWQLRLRPSRDEDSAPG
jgi:MFS family permease